VGLHARRQCFRPEAENGGRDARAPQSNCMVKAKTLQFSCFALGRCTLSAQKSAKCD
jgi:hypothetical protein